MHQARYLAGMVPKQMTDRFTKKAHHLKSLIAIQDHRKRDMMDPLNILTNLSMIITWQKRYLMLILTTTWDIRCSIMKLSIDPSRYHITAISIQLRTQIMLIQGRIPNKINTSNIWTRRRTIIQGRETPTRRPQILCQMRNRRVSTAQTLIRTRCLIISR